MGILDVITSEYHHVPSAGALGAPLFEAEATHRKRHALGRQLTLHVHAHQLDDARGRKELACLLAIGLAQISKNQLFLDVGFLKLAVVALQLGVLLIVKPIAEALLPQRVGLGIDDIIVGGALPRRVYAVDLEGEEAAISRYTADSCAACRREVLASVATTEPLGS